MSKAIKGVVFGALAFFIVNMALWMVAPWHKTILKKLPEETLIRDTMKVVVKEPGVYMFPSQQTDNGTMECKLYKELFKSGPAGFLAYTPGGQDAMGVKNIVIEIITSFLIAGFCMFVLVMSQSRLPSCSGKALMVLALGLFAWFVPHAAYWNWFFFPCSFVLVLLLDYVLAFGIMGLVLAKFVPESL